MGLSGGSSAAGLYSVEIVECIAFMFVDLSTESLLTCFKIIEHYCILGGADFLQVCCIYSVRVCTSVLVCYRHVGVQ